MKILAVADWIDPVIYSEQLKNRMADADIIVGCGDLTFGYLDFIMSELNKPVFFVTGNHVEDNNLQKTSMGTVRLKAPKCFNNLHLKVYRTNGILIGGFQGSVWYNGGVFQYRQWEVYAALLKMFPRLLFNKLSYGRYIDVFVTHAPPFGLGDLTDPCHVGIKAFRWFIRLFKPRLMLHGHVHLYDRNAQKITEYHGTQIINCTGYYKATM